MRRIPRSFLSLRLLAAACGASALLGLVGGAFATDFPISTQQRDTAKKVAQAGVPLSELTPNAPDSYTVKKGDTLWDISKLFLRSPWRWPELWGMNLDQIRNPHLIYPGQLLVLVKGDGMARLVVGRPVDTQFSTDAKRLGPRVRERTLLDEAIASIPVHLIGPFLNDAVVFSTDELTNAPRIVATQEGRVMASRGETVYVRGDVRASRNWRLFREPRPLVDPETQEVLGFEARHVGVAELVQMGDGKQTGKQEVVLPSTFTIVSLREEAGVGDRMAPLPPRDEAAYAPHAPDRTIGGRILSVYGDSLTAGQNQIVVLNRGARDGVERGHVLALWRAGSRRTDATSADRAQLILPDEQHGLLFVFRVFDRVSYALITQVQQPVAPGDRFSQP